MNLDTSTRRWPLWGLLTLAGVALLRLASLGRLALTDNTESRYGSIAWQMFHSGDWITPRVYVKGELVPFWGKPPLQFWLTSLSYHLFGVSEWSARLPSFLIAIALVAATAWFAQQLWGRRVAILSAIILASSLLFFVLSGACVLDVPLAASVAGAMIAFARFAEPGRHRKTWGLAFFLALAVGALAKGPIALVLVAVAIGLWLALVRRWRLLAELPWFRGLLVFAVVAVPWYLLAERATPGFLHYFFINEHFLRYVRNDYGDLYGYGRKRPYGAIWLMLLGSFLPWTLLAVAALVRGVRGQKLRKTVAAEPWLVYLLIWGLVPPLFFTFARQVLFTYVLPGFPALAIATAVGLDRWMASDAAAGLLRLLKWQLIATTLLAAAAAVAAVKMTEVTIPVATALALLVLVLDCMIWAGIRRWGPAVLTPAVGLALAVGVTTGFFLLAPRIEEQKSAKIILGELYRQHPAARQRAVVVPFDESDYSVAYYAEVQFGGRFQGCPPGGNKLIGQLLDRRGDEIFLMRRVDWERLKPALSNRLVPLAQTAHWVACEGKP